MTMKFSEDMAAVYLDANVGVFLLSTSDVL